MANAAKADTEVFEVVRQLRHAPDKRAMATILLRTSDAALFAHQGDIAAECRRQRFPEGAQFIDVRVAALCATRDRSGRLPDREALALENWRVSLSAYSMGRAQ